MSGEAVKILGVDPGGSGAIALLAGGAVRVADMPTFSVTRGKSAKLEVDALALYDMIRVWAPTHCYFEQVGGIPGQSAPAAFNFGRACGLAEAVVKVSGVRIVTVPPATWKRRMGLIGGGKDDARAMATRLWPAAAAEFRRKKDDGRAEAALLAEYGRRLEGATIFS